MMYLLTEQAHAQIVDALENVYGKGKLCDAALAMLKSMEPVAQAVQPAHHIEQDIKMVQPAQVPGWLPIESAPKDGSSYLVWAGGVGMAHYVDNYASGYPHKAPFSENLASWKSKATHWMPLPAAPSHSRMDRILDRQRNDRDEAMSVLSAAPSPKEGQL